MSVAERLNATASKSVKPNGFIEGSNPSRHVSLKIFIGYIMQILCECGNKFTPASRGKGTTRCKTCILNIKRYNKKKRAVEYLGGKCIDCGYNKCIAALEFDHINPALKEFQISGNRGFKWETVQKELDKCVLRCANCHRERHYNGSLKKRQLKSVSVKKK